MKIYLKENQFRNLVEARMDGFRVDYLTNCKSFEERVEYCKKMLGFPIGDGSSRIIFQLDDETCLKLAKDEKGIAQNMEEIEVGLSHKVGFMPKVYNGTDEKNGLWIVTQYVIPAKEEDFMKVLKVDFKDVSLFTVHLDNYINPPNGFMEVFSKHVLDSIGYKYSKNKRAYYLFKNICDLKQNHNQYVGDLSRIDNWGLARKNGRTVLVMLDTGLSEDVYNQFYNVMRNP